ncbi:MAG TPA: hypothetical protein VD816_00550 [Ohtaekwangia sp.]|nr:hypothetical protein [Ohtaekwangia sp.]
MGKKLKAIPFSFVLEQLEGLDPVTKPMFGCHAIYVGEKIVLIVRKKAGSDHDNGVWLATTTEHHESLWRDFPSMRSIKIFGDTPSGWQNLPEEAGDFEASVIKACDLIRKGDPRIGKIPKIRRKKKRP